MYFQKLKIYFIFCVLNSFSVFAVVDLNSIVYKKYQTPLSFNTKFDLDLESGNTKKEEYSLRLSGVFSKFYLGESKSVNYNIFTILNLKNERKKNTLVNKKNMFHLRFKKHMLDDFYFESLFQVEEKPFKKISRRYLLGLGPSISAVQEKKVSILANLILFYEYEKVKNSKDGEKEETHDINKKLRLSLSVFSLLSLSDHVDLTNSLYFQPFVKEVFKDYRVKLVSMLRFLVNTKHAFSFAVNLEYDKKPPFGVDSYYKEFKTSYDFSL